MKPRIQRVLTQWNPESSAFCAGIQGVPVAPAA